MTYLAGGGPIEQHNEKWKQREKREREQTRARERWRCPLLSLSLSSLSLSLSIPLSRSHYLFAFFGQGKMLRNCLRSVISKARGNVFEIAPLLVALSTARRRSPRDGTAIAPMRPPSRPRPDAGWPILRRRSCRRPQAVLPAPVDASVPGQFDPEDERSNCPGERVSAIPPQSQRQE
jgi:hypothetical protein